MPSFQVATPQRNYSAIVERGVLARAADYLPAKHGKVFVISNEDVSARHGAVLEKSLSSIPHQTLFLPGGEENKRLRSIERAAEEMARCGGDRTSVVIAFGGGIVNDLAGFLAAIFMRGVPVLQIPTTLVAQVDAAIGGKTGVNLEQGKNLLGSFHQPIAVLIDPDVLGTLPDREYRAGLYEVIKCGVIRSHSLFSLLATRHQDLLARQPGIVDQIIAESVRIKAEVVSADERESDLRRILNFGHTIGHALEAETSYRRFLHGEAVAFGMRAAVYLAQSTGYLSAEDSVEILETIGLYGPIPSLEGISPQALLARLRSDKKTVQGDVHFVLPTRIGEVKIVSRIPDEAVPAAIQSAMG